MIIKVEHDGRRRADARALPRQRPARPFTLVIEGIVIADQPPRVGQMLTSAEGAATIKVALDVAELGGLITAATAARAARVRQVSTQRHAGGRQ